MFIIWLLLVIPVLKRWSRARGPYDYLRTSPGIHQSQLTKSASHIIHATMCLLPDVATHQEEVSSGSPLSLLLILGYTNGFQIWIIPVSLFLALVLIIVHSF